MLLLTSVFWTQANAQTDESDWVLDELLTPRDKIVSQLNPEPEPSNIPELRGSIDLSNEIEPETITDEITEEIEDVEEIEEAEIAQEIEPDDQDDGKPVPFFVSATDYADLRGRKRQPQLTLVYEVTSKDMDGETVGDPQQAMLKIGPDYVSVQRGSRQKIYDFKLNRFLEFNPAAIQSDTKSPPLLFDNISLYAKAYRNMKNVLGATNTGSTRQIQISDDQSIDAFWLESSMSWAAQALDNPVDFDSQGQTIIASYDGQSVFSAEFSDDNFEIPGLKNALFAYAHHDWPLHPSILLAIYEYDAPPLRMNIMSVGPRHPKGRAQEWVLQDRSFVEKAKFPLPQKSLSATEREPVSPLVFIINEAVNNRALGGMQTPEQIEGEFETAMKDGDNLTQWLAGEKYKAYSGKCTTKDESWICAAHADLTETHKFASINEIDPKAKMLSDFISAVEMAKDKKSRGTALHTLQPYLDDPGTPALVLRTAAMARASMKKSDAGLLGLESVQADALLKQALAKDPYDPKIYVGLAQVYAANGAFEQSWDIYDALRAAIPTVSAVELKIDAVEGKLRINAAGYFLAE